MLRPVLCFCVLLCAASRLLAVEPGDILPKDVKWDPRIPTPEKHFGFKIGQRHVYHHEIVSYLRQLAVASDRVVIQEYARSYGGRPLVMAVITSAKNHKQLQVIRQQHARLADPESSAGVDLKKLPAVINMGYSVHGNEPSAGNAATLVAYYLAAAQGKDHKRLLDNVIVLLDPCLNPDGFERFAHWANDHRGAVPNADPNHREHREPWPSGRTNYYWFDLNRDWLPVQHPESQGRVAMFHNWKPNVVLDFHEMGTDATYFFQPGDPKRNHPFTPLRTLELTRKFADFHAAALDQAGSLYYTEETFDDFYIGKGSTYPDLHGSIGILFEQASARGHLQDSVNGPVSFAFAIRNHFLTSLSSLRATLQYRVQLLEHKRTFYRDAIALARSGKTKGYVVSAPADPARLHHFLEILARHQIHAYRLAADIRVDGHTFRKGESFVIPAAQPEFRFLQATFEKRTEFEENVFYDVSTWTLPLAFNLQYAVLEAPPAAEQLGEPFSPGEIPSSKLVTKPDDSAYVIDWRSYYAPKVLHQLLAKEVKVKVATRPFRLNLGGQETPFGYGTLLVPIGIQQEKRGEITQIVKGASAQSVVVHPTTTSLTSHGIDFGSSSFVVVPEPKVLLVTGTGVSSSQAGEVWHLLDRRFEMPVTLVEDSRLNGISLNDYTVVVMVSGSYGSISSTGVERLKRFVSDGGTIVAIGTAARWIDQSKILKIEFRTASDDGKEAHSATGNKQEKPTPAKRRPYAEAARDAALKLVRGAIFRTRVDHTHPVGYGFSESETLPVFRNNTVFLEAAKNAYSTPVLYDEKPLLSGYVSPENLKLISGSASVVVRSNGRGRVVLIAEDPNFRAFWYGTNRVFLNALFFGPITRVP